MPNYILMENGAPVLESIASLHPVLMTMDQCVVLDLETTGFSLEKWAEIIEIAAVKVDLKSRKIVQKFHSYVCPSRVFSIPKKITELTGIDWEKVGENPYVEEVLPALARFIGDLPVVAHNAIFDWIRFLLPAFEMVGLHATNRCICSMRLAKDVRPGLGKSGYNLEALSCLYGHTMTNHHEAMADTVTTAAIFTRLLSEYRQQHMGDGLTMFANGNYNPPKPSEIPSVNFSNLEVRRVSPYKGTSKKAGQEIYVITNYGKVCYSVRRRVWTCKELWTDKNAPVQTWGRYILNTVGMDTSSFVERYRIAS